MKYNDYTHEYYVEIPLLRHSTQPMIDLKPDLECASCLVPDSTHHSWQHRGYYHGVVWSSVMSEPPPRPR
jgi:hypothetical protein